MQAHIEASELAVADLNCTVTLNFPDMQLVSLAYVPSILDDIPAYSDLPLVSQGPFLLEKLQPPLFWVHRCHHASVEHGDDANAIELPTGFLEAVQHISEMPSHVSTTITPEFNSS
jgi:hypothetical protein